MALGLGAGEYSTIGSTVVMPAPALANSNGDFTSSMTKSPAGACQNVTDLGLVDKEAGDLAVAVVVILIGVRINRPTVTWPWYVLAAAMALFFFGSVARVSFGTLGVITDRRSVIPDLITIPGYLCAAVGFFGIVHARSAAATARSTPCSTPASRPLRPRARLAVPPQPDRARALPTRGSASCSRSTRPSRSSSSPSPRLAFSRGAHRLVANNLLLGSMLAVLAGDVIYTLIETHVLDVPKNLVDLPYGLGLLLLIATVLHPSMREMTTPVPVAETTPTVGRLVVVAIALAVPGLITVTRVDVPLGDRIAMTVIVLSLTAAAITRLFRAVRAHARSEARLVHQATHDLLTGLPNRAYVHEYVGQALARASAHERVALMFLDVDRFKLVNDSYGHTQGDAFLVSVASGCAPASGRRTSWRASAATSSWWSRRRSTPTPRRSSSGSGPGACSPHRSRCAVRSSRAR